MLIGTEIQKYISDPLSLGKVEQSGYDLTIKIIKALDVSEKGYWFLNNRWEQPAILREKTHIPDNFYKELQTTYFFANQKGVTGWILEPGIYSLTFDQGLSLPNNITGIVVHRSSVARVGGEISAGIYDPGFSTVHIGAILTLTRSIFIEEHSSLAKIIMYQHNEVPEELLYKGQYSKLDLK